MIFENLDLNPRIQERFGELGTVLHKPRSLGIDDLKVEMQEGRAETRALGEALLPVKA